MNLALMITHLGVRDWTDIGIVRFRQRRMVWRQDTGCSPDYRADLFIHGLLLWSTNDLLKSGALLCIVRRRQWDAWVLREVLVVVCCCVGNRACLAGLVQVDVGMTGRKHRVAGTHDGADFEGCCGHGSELCGLWMLLSSDIWEDYDLDRGMPTTVRAEIDLPTCFINTAIFKQAAASVQVDVGVVTGTAMLPWWPMPCTLPLVAADAPQPIIVNGLQA